LETWWLEAADAWYVPVVWQLAQTVESVFTPSWQAVQPGGFVPVVWIVTTFVEWHSVVHPSLEVCASAGAGWSVVKLLK